MGGVVGSVKPGDALYDVSEVWYSIDQGNEAGLFDIDNLSGDIIVTGALDADTDAEHNIRVSLNDNVYGMSRQIIRVKIILTDVNDNPPLFDRQVSPNFQRILQSLNFVSRNTSRT